MTPSAPLWSSTSIQAVLRNPVYIGQIRWRKETFEAEGAGKPIRPRSRRGLVLVNEPSEHVSTPNTVEGDDDL